MVIGGIGGILIFRERYLAATANPGAVLVCTRQAVKSSPSGSCDAGAWIVILPTSLAGSIDLSLLVVALPPGMHSQ
jgi:hypothetical protein